MEYGLHALVKAARRLIIVDSDRFMRVLALCVAYLAIYEDGPPTTDELLAQCEMISPRKQRDSA